MDNRVRKIVVVDNSVHKYDEILCSIHYEQKGCHLIGVYRVPRAGLEARLGVHITSVSGLFVVVVASTGVVALVLWGVLGLYEVFDNQKTNRKPRQELAPCSTAGARGRTPGPSSKPPSSQQLRR